MFKAGDKVAIYGITDNFEPIRIVSTVEAVRYEMLKLNVETSYKTGEYDFSLAHPKQCRKIKRKKALGTP